RGRAGSLLDEHLVALDNELPDHVRGESHARIACLVADCRDDGHGASLERCGSTTILVASLVGTPGPWSAHVASSSRGAAGGCEDGRQARRQEDLERSAASIPMECQWYQEQLLDESGLC